MPCHPHIRNPPQVQRDGIAMPSGSAAQRLSTSTMAAETVGRAAAFSTAIRSLGVLTAPAGGFVQLVEEVLHIDGL